MNLITLSAPRSAAAEAYRSLRTNLMFSAVDSDLRKIAVSAPSDTDDKSLTLANLAVTLAQSGNSTLIIDADLRQPVQHSLWNVSNERGLTTMILEEAYFNAPPIQKTSLDNLSVLTSGVLPTNPADVLASRRVDDVINKLAGMADYLLFDVPPVLVATDAAVLGRKLDGVLLVIKAGTTRRDAAQRAKSQLDRVQVNLIGAVMTNAPQESKRYGA